MLKGTMQKLKVGESERELLMHIARNPDATVREIVDGFGASRGWGRTTVLKTVDRLMEKRLLDRNDVEGVFRYRTLSSEAELQRQLVHQFLLGSMEGSLKPVVAYLDGADMVTDEELSDLKALVERLESRRAK